MIDPKHVLPVTRQCRILGVGRSTYYYEPVGESQENMALMRVIDELYLERPTRGSRSMRDALEDRGVFVGRHPAMRRG